MNNCYLYCLLYFTHVGAHSGLRTKGKVFREDAATQWFKELGLKQSQLPSPWSSAPSANSHSFLLLTWTWCSCKSRQIREFNYLTTVLQNTWPAIDQNRDSPARERKEGEMWSGERWHHTIVVWFGLRFTLHILQCTLMNTSPSGRGSTTSPLPALATELCQGSCVWRYMFSCAAGESVWIKSNCRNKSCFQPCGIHFAKSLCNHLQRYSYEVTELRYFSQYHYYRNIYHPMMWLAYRLQQSKAIWYHCILTTAIIISCFLLHSPPA